ncbi:MAG: hypothetical protein Q8R95_00585 [Azonexus sp.]|nr:hypothetical protein [Azonexus sp.]
MTHRKQSGSILTLVLLGLLAAGVLATIAYGSYYQIARGVQDTVLKANASALLTQAAYALAAEAGDTDSDGVAEPPAANAGKIPASSGAPKSDAWGTAFLYCPWDNGAVNSSAERIDGENPAQQTSIQFALVSAGPDKVFATDCAQAKTGLPAVGSDDGVRTRTVSQITQGVGGTYFYGDPVANKEALLLLTGSPVGMMRIAKDSNITYSWNGGAWVPLTAVAALVAGVTAGGNCNPYPAGALVRDAADDLYMCGSGNIWIKFAKAS